MKAPTADYSPLSQALSAKSSAIQSGYAAKDASNWKSRYKIQQKSLDLQKQSIDNSDKWNTANAVINGLGLVLDAASLAVNYKDQKEALDKDNENLKANQGWNLYGQQANEIIAKYGDKAYSENKVVEYGANGREEKTYTQINPEMQRELNEKFTEVFGSQEDWSEDAWNAIQNNKQIASSALRESMWQSYNKAVSTQNANLLNTQYNGLMTEAVQNEGTSMMPFTYSDGNGGTTTGYVPKSVYNLISNLSSVPDATKTNMLISAAEDYKAQRLSYVTGSVVDAIKGGDLLLNEDGMHEAASMISNVLDGITDKEQRKLAEDSISKAITGAVSDYFTETFGNIDDNSKTRQSDYSLIKDALAPGGTYDAFFSGELKEYIAPSTRTTLRTNVESTISAIETANGSKDADAIAQGIEDLKLRKEQNPNLSATEMTEGFRAIFRSVYGNDWEQDPEAVRVYNDKILSLMPKNLSTDPLVVATVKGATPIVFSGIEDYDKLSDEQKAKLEIAKQYACDAITSAVLADPGKAFDTVAWSNLVWNAVRDYDAAYFDSIEWTADNGYQSYSDYILSVTDGGGKWYEATDIDPRDFSAMGRIGLNGMNLDRGRSEKVVEAISEIGSYINDTEGFKLDGIAGAQFQYQMDESGNPVLDEDGNPKLQALVWNLDPKYVKDAQLPEGIWEAWYMIGEKDHETKIVGRDMYGNPIDMNAEKGGGYTPVTGTTLTGKQADSTDPNPKFVADDGYVPTREAFMNAAKEALSGIDIPAEFNSDAFARRFAEMMQKQSETDAVVSGTVPSLTDPVFGAEGVEAPEYTEEQKEAARKNSENAMRIVRENRDKTAMQTMAQATSPEELDEVVAQLSTRLDAAKASSVKGNPKTIGGKAVKGLADKISSTINYASEVSDTVGLTPGYFNAEQKLQQEADAVKKTKDRWGWDREPEAYEIMMSSSADNEKVASSDEEKLRACSSEAVFQDVLEMLESDIEQGRRSQQSRGVYVSKSMVEDKINKLRKLAEKIGREKGWYGTGRAGKF